MIEEKISAWAKIETMSDDLDAEILVDYKKESLGRHKGCRIIFMNEKRKPVIAVETAAEKEITHGGATLSERLIDDFEILRHSRQEFADKLMKRRGELHGPGY